MSHPAPASIRVLSEQREVELTWPDGEVQRIAFRYLRENCRCAVCVDEDTGRRVLDISTIPENIHPRSAQLVGNYALKITWSDGHSDGLYTWPHLVSLG